MKRGHETLDEARDLSGEQTLKKFIVNEKFIFEIKHAEAYLHECPFFRQPAEFGAFSLDIDRKYMNTNEKMREYVPSVKRDPQFDLNVGFKTLTARDEDVQERLDHLLQWVDLHRDRFKLSTDSHPVSLHTDFLTWRGHLVKILLTPYEKREPWRMDACKHNGTIFISEVETEEKRVQRLKQSERQKEMCYWGYKFEDYMTKPLSGNKATEKCSKNVTNNCEAYCSVVRTRMSSHSLVFGAEVDCCTLTDGKVKGPGSYVELKTTRILDNPRQARNFANFKLIKFWAQSFLAGVPKVVCGMRDDNGIVRKIKNYVTLDIPDIALREGARWKPAVCLNFLDQFLQWMKEKVVDDDHNVVYSFRYQEPFHVIEMKRLPYGEECFLPDWFLK
ncbi:decapping and exoribonuclease protein-like [Rhopilema esculentum]|uniref:decapping and exoribonuclease protein-like n=1 Tax=Rhopilema esculentum TaxID=499914 RepID=UPI0031E17C55|eukprot:gene9612-17371_t